MSLLTLEENIARLEKATEEARQATREAHAARKDLLRVQKEVEALLGPEVAEQVSRSVNDALRDELRQVLDAAVKASHDTYARVLNQVDLLINLALGKPGKMAGKEKDLRPELAEKIRLWILEQMRDV